MVPIIGWIMPEPFAMPAMRDGAAAAEVDLDGRLLRHRVGGHDRAGRLAVGPLGRLPAPGPAGPMRSRSTSSREPMSPVEAVKTCRVGDVQALRDAAPARRLASSSPCAPVPALAQPALAITAATWPPEARSERIETSTGAARSRFFVKVAAAGTGPRSLTRSIDVGTRSRAAGRRALPRPGIRAGW